MSNKNQPTDIFIHMTTKKCGIYKITSPSNKTYIGKSRDIKHRWNAYKRLDCDGQYAILNALKKYGPENCSFEILEVCSVEKLTEREMHYISKFKSDVDGYNLTKGGEGMNPTEETRKKMSAAGKGKVFSNSTLLKMSLAKKGIPKGPQSELHNKIKTTARRNNHPNWGIRPCGKKFAVLFKENGVIYKKGKFPTFADAKEWRDSIMSNQTVPA